MNVTCCTDCFVSCKAKTYLLSRRLAMTGGACIVTSINDDLQSTVFVHTEPPKENAVELSTTTAVCNPRPAAHIRLLSILRARPYGYEDVCIACRIILGKQGMYASDIHLLSAMCVGEMIAPRSLSKYFIQACTINLAGIQHLASDPQLTEYHR